MHNSLFHETEIWICLCAGLLALFPLRVFCQVQAVHVYVAPNGNDANPGTRERSFATLTRARDAVRALKAKGLRAPVEVIIRGGVYCLTKPLVLTPQDSGTPRCPITWRAAKGERVLICGGKRVTGWKRYRRGIYVADLKSQGLVGARFHQLFYRNGRKSAEFARRQVLARYPNFDPKHPRTGGFLLAAKTAPKPTEHLVYPPGAVPFDRWRNISQAEVVSVYHGWLFAITPIRSVDAKTRTITFCHIRAPIEKLDRFFIQNVFDALDAPGEWFHDRQRALLYFWPPKGEAVTGQVIAPVVDDLIELRGTIPYSFAYLNVAFKGYREKSPLPANPPPMKPVEYVTFRGLNFECARQDAIRMVGARHCAVIGCRVTNVGNIGINLGGVTSTFPEVGNPRVTPARGRATGGAGGGGQILLLNDPCMNCRVVGCDVWATGCEGVMLLGADNLAENNHVWDIGLYAKDAPCINMLGERNVARRNTLHDCPRCAVFIKGVDNVVELNDVHHTCLETCDMGGIRMVQRNVFLRGNKIRFNRILDTVGYGFRRGSATHYESPFDTIGVYLDDYTSGTEVTGNIIARAGTLGVSIHGGGHNLIANNVIYNAGFYSVEFAPIHGGKHPSFVGCFAGNRIERNILVCTGGDTFPYHFTSAVSEMPTFENNLIWSGGREPIFLIRRRLGIRGIAAWARWSGEKGSMVADPKLLDPEHDSFLPAADSPAWKLGFKRIPVEQIGCYRSADRATWPLRPNRERLREKPVLYAAPGYQPEKSRPFHVQLLGPVAEDFEADAVGQPPGRGDVAAPPPSSLAVTNELAAKGKQCLKFVDAPGLPRAWMPRIYYPLDFGSGVALLSFDLRLDGRRPPDICIDSRQYSDAGGKEFLSGPTLSIHADGELLSRGKMLMKLPFDRWTHFDLRIPLGEGVNKRSTLTVTVRGSEPKRFTVRHVTRGFRRLERLVVFCPADRSSIFYLDNLEIHCTGP